MRELWRKSVELLKEHPVLWAPYAVAQLLAFLLLKLLRIEIRAILEWLSMTTSRSVLGDTTQIYDPAGGQHRAILLGGLLENGTHYVNACLLTLAFVVTAVTVVEFLRGEELSRAGVGSALRPYAKRILLFALKFCVAVWVLTAAILLPLSYFLNVVLPASRTAFLLIVNGESLLMMALVAWIMAPIAIALLRPMGAPPLSVVQKKTARSLALLAVVASFVLQFLIHWIDAQFRFPSNIVATAASGLSTLAINIPLALLFIAFALIAADQLPESVSGSALNLRQIALRFMPLHFHPDPKADQN